MTSSMMSDMARGTVGSLVSQAAAPNVHEEAKDITEIAIVFIMIFITTVVVYHHIIPLVMPCRSTASTGRSQKG